MRFALSLFALAVRPNARRRSTLLELHRRGVVQVFRRPSLFRLWEPLREQRGRDQEFSD